MQPVPTITNDETVHRILHQDWVINGNFQLGAFTLRPNKTYISVNRPSIYSYTTDVNSFVESHPAYQHTPTTYRCGVLHVSSIRQIKLEHDGKPLSIDVEIEPRAARAASHAGIFTRWGTTNLKQGTALPTEALPLGLSADDVLMEVGWSLIAITDIKEKSIRE